MEVTPAQLPFFQWNDENKQEHIFTISNGTSNRRHQRTESAVFYKIRTTAPRHFSVEPSEGFVEPGKQVDIKVTMKAAMGPEDSQPRFQIRAVQCANAQENPGDPYDPDSWAAIESRGIGFRHIIECARATVSVNGVSGGASRSESLQERIAEWHGKNEDARARNYVAAKEPTLATRAGDPEDGTINAAERDLTRLRNEYLELSGKFEKQKEKIVKLEVDVTMAEQENAALQSTLHDQRGVIVLHETQRKELVQQYRQQQQKVASFEEALRLERMTAAAMPTVDEERERERKARLARNVGIVSRKLSDIKMRQAETRAVASVCLQALREDVVTFSQVLVQQYEQAYRTGDVPSFPQSPKSKDVPNKIEKSIELWCCVVPNEANYLAEGPGSVRVRDESSVEIQAGQETLPFEFDLVTQLTRDISGHNDPSFRKWQVIVNQQLRRGPGRATMLSFGGANAAKTALLEGSGVGVARIGVGIMSHTMRHLCQLYQGQVEITISCIEVYDGEARDLLSTDAATSTANPARNVHLDRSQKIMLQHDEFGHIFYSNVIAVRLHGPDDFDRVHGIVSGRRRMHPVRAGEDIGPPIYDAAAHCITLLTINNSSEPSVGPAKIYFVDVAAIDSSQIRESKRDIEALEGILSGSGGRRTNLTDLLQDAMRPDATTVSCYSVPDICRRESDSLDVLVSASTTIGLSAPPYAHDEASTQNASVALDLEHAFSLRQEFLQAQYEAMQDIGTAGPQQKRAPAKGGVGAGKKAMAAAPWK